MEIVQQHIIAIQALCRQYHVLQLYTFGSILSTRFSAESEIDLLVNFSDVGEAEYADNFFDFKYALETLLQRPIDLLESKTIQNPYLAQSIHQQKKLIYG